MAKKTWGGARKGAGAPVTVDISDKKIVRSVPFSQKEWETIGEQAAERGISKAEYIRRKVFATAED